MVALCTRYHELKTYKKYFIQDLFMYIISDDDPDRVESCTSLHSFNVIQLCKHKDCSRRSLNATVAQSKNCHLV